MKKEVKEKFNKLIKESRQALKLVDSAPKINFKELIKENWRSYSGIAEYAGIYLIYEGENIIYIGSAGKGGHWLRYRIGDLFFYSNSTKSENRFHHYLSRKLIEKYKRFKNIKSLRSFYMNKCKIKIIKTESVEGARAIEYILIAVFKPKYNA